MLEANHSIRLEGGDCLNQAPVWEGRNPPTPETAGSASENKVPDFYFGLIDHHAPDPRNGVRNFVVECKRLGPPSTAGSVFNRRYVRDGIARFVHPDWRYGKDVATGAMIGYLEDMELAEALAEVNATSDQEAFAEIVQATNDPPLAELTQTLTRSFEVSPFRLTHVWLCELTREP